MTIDYPIHHARRRRPARGFTITELIVAITIIVIIAGITAISVRSLAREARLSSGTNTVVAALDTARGMAIRENTLVVVVFRPRLEGTRRQAIEIVTAKWTGESPRLNVSGLSLDRVIDRFVPIPELAVRRLPVDISVSGPLYHSTGGGTTLDEVWGFPSYLPATAPFGSAPLEAPGRVFGVMYAPDGTIVTRNAASEAHRLYVDFNNDGRQQILGLDINYADPPTISQNQYSSQMMLQRSERDEPLITIVPFLAVYDERKLREESNPDDWLDGNVALKEEVINEFINENSDRIHFNRYTGVVMR